MNSQVMEIYRGFLRQITSFLRRFAFSARISSVIQSLNQS